MLPARVQNAPAIIERYGQRGRDLLHAQLRSDELADRAIAEFVELGSPGQASKQLELALRGDADALSKLPPAARQMFEAVRSPPDWVDWESVDRGGRVLIRTGLLGGLVLALRSLIIGYKAPGGNKPLTLSGRLEAQAPRRLNETTRFVQAVSYAGGMRPGGDGEVITMKVRLMHAQVRRLLYASNKWDDAAWGIPINQHDMTSTIQLFGTEMLNGLELIGVALTAQEIQDVMNLWRWVGVVIGVEPGLLPATWEQGRELMAIVDASQLPPDDDARALVHALLHVPLLRATSEPERVNIKRQMGLVHGLFRHLNGPQLSDQLGVPPSRWVHALRGFKPMVRGFEATRTRVPSLDRAMSRLGLLYWDHAVSKGLGERPATFAPPEVLPPHRLDQM